MDSGISDTPEGGADPGEGVTAPSFLDLLPTEAARAAYLAWRAARQGKPVPDLADLAPHRLPPQVLPWLSLQRERADGEIVYGLAGEEIIHMLGRNPKGRPLMENAPAAERERRLATVRRAMQSGRPVWLTASLMFDNRVPVPVGRIGLPARSRGERVLLLIYFLLGQLPIDLPKPLVLRSLHHVDEIWCSAEELAATFPGESQSAS